MNYLALDRNLIQSTLLLEREYSRFEKGFASPPFFALLLLPPTP
jgi:hypothetical protein